MKKDIYPIAKIPFEHLLIENNYLLDDKNVWKKFIHQDYCIHEDKKGELCRRKKIIGKEYCGRHAPKEEYLINRCNYNNCKKIVKPNNLCHIHKKQFNDICNILLPCVNDEELVFYGHNIYKCNGS